MKKRKYLLLLISVLLGTSVMAQRADSTINLKDTGRQETEMPGANQAPGLITSEGANTLTLSAAPEAPADTTAVDSIMRIVGSQFQPPKEIETQRILEENKFINVESAPEYFVIDIKSSQNDKEIAFYIVCGLLLLLGIFKTFYSHYFSTLFTVYFNTSLRQSQLSEQLSQARFPSFVLNVFFVLVAGAFCWLLFMTQSLRAGVTSPSLMLQLFLFVVAAVYIIKYGFLKFIGWISGFQRVTDYYIFIIFLVNKILAIVLLPFVVVMIFGKPEWMNIYIVLAMLFVGTLFLSRYIKSYGLLRQQFPMSPFHFVLFFLGAELLPLLLIYKVTINYLIV